MATTGNAMPAAKANFCLILDVIPPTLSNLQLPARLLFNSHQALFRQMHNSFTSNVEVD
ncbi:MAG TPA: hypothetical protein V6D35_08875 [Candidatus Sericytochromatia bacterium]